MGPKLAWVNPEPVERGAAPPEGLRLLTPDLRVVAPPAIPPRPVKLDLAVERHLTGGDGLSRDQFLVFFSGRGASVL